MRVLRIRRKTGLNCWRGPADAAPNPTYEAHTKTSNSILEKLHPAIPMQQNQNDIWLKYEIQKHIFFKKHIFIFSTFISPSLNFSNQYCITHWHICSFALRAFKFLSLDKMQKLIDYMWLHNTLFVKMSKLKLSFLVCNLWKQFFGKLKREMLNHITNK